MKPRQTLARSGNIDRMLTWTDVVKLGAKLPEVEESTSYGTAALKVRGKLLIRAKEDGESIVVRTPDAETKDALLDAFPAVFFTTPHYDGTTWVLVRLAKLGRAAFSDLLREAYVTVAPKKLVAALPKRR